MQTLSGRRIARVLAPLIGSGLFAADAGGQLLRGRVLDAAASSGIATVRIELLSGSRSHGTVISDSLGRFALAAPRAGKYELRAARIGYTETLIPRLDLLGSETVEIEITMAVDAVPLAPLRVVARGRTPSSRLRTVGFYDREEHGVGTFLTRYEIEKKGGTLLSDVLRSVNGVRLMRADRTGRTWDVRLRNPRCPPSVYIDGAVVRTAGPARPAELPLDDLALAIDVDGIEIYNGPSETPPQFNREAQCGVIVLWTRVRR